MAKQFQVGDIVALRSGGPEMTVKSPADRDGDVWCMWFVGKRLQENVFPEESLIKPAFVMETVGGSKWDQVEKP